MKIYKIVEDDSSPKAEQRVEKNAIRVAKVAAKVAIIAAAPVPAGAVALMKSLSSQAISLPWSETCFYTNGTNAEWKIGALYAEHPRRNHVLIPVGEYKEYIKREMVADIANYIMDHLSVKRLVIGVVSSNKAKANADIPVSEVNVNASINCNIERNYIARYEDVRCSAFMHEYFWIDRFPDVRSAVEHQTKRFEVINETSVELEVGAKVAEKIGGAFNKEKKLQLYISYYCD